jgi:peroxiredoxin
MIFALSVNPSTGRGHLKVVSRDRPGKELGMAALGIGAKAPEFELNTDQGKKFSITEELGRSPVVLAFFKVSCPTCQYALPFLERLYKAYGNRSVTLIGVSQNNAKDTGAFVRQYGITFPIVLDDTNTYPVSNAYGLTNVPTIFWIAQDGEIEISSVGWVKAEFEQINRKIAEIGKLAPAPVFRPGEDVRDFRAG